MYPAERCGQCTNNTFGSWFSYPREGMCASGKEVGADGCTWAVKSYSMKDLECLTSRVKLQCAAWLAAGRSEKPDQKLISWLTQALEAKISTAFGPESSGGCPEVPLSSDEMATVIV